jgi:exopolysaccharide biosynthesis protein
MLEGTIAGNTNILAPRTAVGFSRDSSTLYLLVVDGRSTLSAGMTTVQLAAMLQRLGAWHAMNFDGGGSTTMVIDGQVVNAPSDPTGERPVRIALFVVRKP